MNLGRAAVGPNPGLNLSYGFRRQMDFLDEALVAELSFSGTPRLCRIPWAALMAIHEAPERQPITGNRYMVSFVDSIPPGLRGPVPPELRDARIIVTQAPWPVPAPASSPKLKFGLIRGGKE